MFTNTYLADNVFWCQALNVLNLFASEDFTVIQKIF